MWATSSEVNVPLFGTALLLSGCQPEASCSHDGEPVLVHAVQASINMTR